MRCAFAAVALVLTLLAPRDSAQAANDTRRIKVVQTVVREDNAHILVYTTDEHPRLRILLYCKLGEVGCFVPVAGDVGLFRNDDDVSIYEGPNACISYDGPKQPTGCYAVQSSSLE